MIGTKLAHYQITAHLGSGGMGDVYQATDSKLGRSVAIKLLPEAFTHDADRAARFEREARVLASLNHPTLRRFTALINREAESSSSWSWCPGKRLPNGSSADRYHMMNLSESGNRSAKPSKPRTKKVS